jgi:hypothetical protein
MADNITQAQLNIRELLTKKPFTRIMPDGHYDHGYTWDDVSEVPLVHDRLRRKIVTQEDFMRELDPAGHLINDKELFPDVWQKNEEDGKWYIQEIPRYAFSFQQIILVKHLTHLCGNDIQFELSDKSVIEETQKVFNEHRNGWANKNMEVAWYQLVKSVKATGDGAFIGFLDKGKFGWKVLSFLNGDKLFPHYDLRTGKLNTLARTYCNYAEDGTVTKRYIDVWDDTNYYRFVADGDPTSLLDKAKQLISKLFTTDGYKLEWMEKHGFDSIPVSYMRDDNGPCWTYSEETIENYEVAFSNLAHSNHDFGLPIMYVKGEGSEELTTNDMSYASKIMILPSDGEIGFLNKQDASNAYKAELDKLEDSIYKQSFAVKTPELKSGDTPGVALKIMYSDAYEKAMTDAHEYDGAVDKMIEIFNWGYGIESEKRLAFVNTNIRHYIEPYIHLNFSELTQNLNTAVLGGFLSKQTASEKLPYSTPQEWNRILQEKHDEQMQQLLLEEQKLEIQNEANVEMQEELAEIQTEQQVEVIKAQNQIQDKNEEKQGKPTNKKKYSVATGRGQGRPNRSGKKWDENGNYEGRNNWDSWNLRH